jgi:aromatase
MTNNVANWPSLFTEYATAEILGLDGDSVVFRLTMHPDETGKVWSWVSRRRMDLAKREVHAHRVETGPFEYMNIYWSYREEPGGVRMTWIQDFQMKPTAPVTDEQMVARLNTNSPIQLNVIKQRIEAEQQSGRGLPNRTSGKRDASQPQVRDQTEPSLPNVTNTFNSGEAEQSCPNLGSTDRCVG